LDYPFPECFPVGSRLRLECDIEGPGAPIQVLGHVLWVAQLPEADRWHTGVQFSELSGGARIRLREIVAEQAQGT